MGVTGKLRSGLGHLVDEAERTVHEGVEKFDAAHQRKVLDGLLRDLGAAYYDWERRGGSAVLVSTAITAVDEHRVEHGGKEVVLPAPRAAGTSAPRHV